MRAWTGQFRGWFVNKKNYFCNIYIYEDLLADTLQIDLYPHQPKVEFFYSYKTWNFAVYILIFFQHNNRI